MNRFKIFALAAVAGVAMVATVPVAQAQISVSIGSAPACPYGYYDYAPGPAVVDPGYTSPYYGSQYYDAAPNWNYQYGPAYAPGCGAGAPHC